MQKLYIRISQHGVNNLVSFPARYTAGVQTTGIVYQKIYIFYRFYGLIFQVAPVDKIRSARERLRDGFRFYEYCAAKQNFAQPGDDFIFNRISDVLVEIQAIQNVAASAA